MEWATLPRAAMPTRPSLAKVIDVQLVTERWVAGGEVPGHKCPVCEASRKPALDPSRTSRDGRQLHTQYPDSSDRRLAEGGRQGLRGELDITPI